MFSSEIRMRRNDKNHFQFFFRLRMYHRFNPFDYISLVKLNINFVCLPNRQFCDSKIQRIQRIQLIVCAKLNDSPEFGYSVNFGFLSYIFCWRKYISILLFSVNRHYLNKRKRETKRRERK